MPGYDIIVIGAGIAGLYAAAGARERANVSILIVDSKPYTGGVLPQCIHRGFGNGLTGKEYLEEITKKVCSSDIDILLNATVLNIDEKKTVRISTKEGIKEVSFKKLILSSGCREKSFASLNVSGTRPGGIYTAGQVQEMINLMHMDVGDEAVIVGCGDLGMIIARRLVLTGKKVICIIEKEKTYTGLRRNYTECIEHFGINVLFSTTLKKVYGQDEICAVELDSGKIIKCKTLITACGMEEEISLIRGIENKKWVYRCGNCNKVYSTVESAAANAVVVGKRASEDLLREGFI